MPWGQQAETRPAVSLDCITPRPDAAAGRRAGTAKLCSGSVAVYHQNQTWKKQRCYVDGSVKQVGRDASQHSVCFVSLHSSVQLCLIFFSSFFRGGKKMKNSRDNVKWQQCPHSFPIPCLGAGQSQNTERAHFLKESVILRG